MLNVCNALCLLSLALFMPAHMRIFALLVLHSTQHTLTVAQNDILRCL